MSPAIGDPCHIDQDDQGNWIGVAPGIPNIGDAASLDGDHGVNNGTPAVGDPAVISQDDQGVWIGRSGAGAAVTGQLWYISNLSSGTPEMVAEFKIPLSINYCKIVVDSANAPHIFCKITNSSTSKAYLYEYRKTSGSWVAITNIGPLGATGYDTEFEFDVWYDSTAGGGAGLYWYIAIMSYVSKTKGVYPPINCYLFPDSLASYFGIFSWAPTNSTEDYSSLNCMNRPILTGVYPLLHLVITTLDWTPIFYKFNYVKFNVNTFSKTFVDSGQNFRDVIRGMAIHSGYPVVAYSADTDVHLNNVEPIWMKWNGTTWATFLDRSAWPSFVPAGFPLYYGNTTRYRYGIPWNQGPWFMVDKNGSLVQTGVLMYLGSYGFSSIEFGLIEFWDGTEDYIFDEDHMAWGVPLGANGGRVFDLCVREITSSYTHDYENLFNFRERSVGNGKLVWQHFFWNGYPSSFSVQYRLIETTKVIQSSLGNSGPSPAQAAYIKSP